MMRNVLVVGLAAALCCSSTAFGKGPATKEKIPVIFDTDIGDDIDDTWALALLLKSSEFDVKLIVGDQGKSIYRAKLIAKLLETAGRTDIPIGIGLDVNAHGNGRQQAWVEDYDLKSYPGKVHRDGVQAIIDTILGAPKPITLIAVGPMPNIAAALKREPRIADKARFVGMHGSVRRGYGGSDKIAAEYNVRADAKACQTVFTAPWEMTITPLDTCGIVHLRGDRYAKVRDCKDPLVRALIANYRIWAGDPKRAETASSTLFDTVAIYLAITQELCKMETLPIRVTDDGKTVIDPAAKKMQVATEWKDLGQFEEFLVERLTE
ncbi:MAG: nucleoside hydrolase [Thermoguttaceae bacterium]